MIKENKVMFWIVAVLGLVCGMIVADEIVVKHVIHRIQKEYSPSPYGPGFDPDKVDVIKMDKK